MVAKAAFPRVPAFSETCMEPHFRHECCDLHRIKKMMEKAYKDGLDPGKRQWEVCLPVGHPLPGAARRYA